MKEDLLPLLRCPRCQPGTLRMNITEVQNNEIREGLLVCDQCRSEFPIHDGIPEFLHRLTTAMREEIESSTDYTRDICFRKPEVYNDEFLLTLPYTLPISNVEDKLAVNVAGSERKAPYFFQILNSCGEGNGKRLLELGAGTTWATWHFAKKGYTSIALDIVKVLYRGLMSRDVYFQHKNIYYEAVLSPMESLPLQDNSIDLVFSINSLHHSCDLNVILSEVYRVLRNGGVFYLMEDGFALPFLFFEKVKAWRKRKMEHHQDHVYMFRDYKNAITKTSLTMELVLPDRFINRIGFLRNLPRWILVVLYKIILYTRGCGFILKIKKAS
ncbi:MAG: methyltransferase domain-containing protein [Candidatus Omnitrophota bacterium]